MHATFLFFFSHSFLSTVFFTSISNEFFSSAIHTNLFWLGRWEVWFFSLHVRVRVRVCDAQSRTLFKSHPIKSMEMHRSILVFSTSLLHMFCSSVLLCSSRAFITRILQLDVYSWMCFTPLFLGPYSLLTVWARTGSDVLRCHWRDTIGLSNLSYLVKQQ